MKCFQVELAYFGSHFHQLCSDNTKQWRIGTERTPYLGRQPIYLFIVYACYWDCIVGHTQGNFKLAGLARAQYRGNYQEFTASWKGVSALCRACCCRRLGLSSRHCVAGMTLASFGCKYVIYVLILLSWVWSTTSEDGRCNSWWGAQENELTRKHNYLYVSVNVIYFRYFYLFYVSGVRDNVDRSKNLSGCESKET